MSPEEFDSRLKSSFQDEYLPPKDQLWQNIDHRLDQNAKKTFWYWFAPFIIVIAAGIVWLSSGISSEQQKKDTSIEERVSTAANDLTGKIDTPVAIEVNEKKENNSRNIIPNNHNDNSKNESKSDDENVADNAGLTNIKYKGTADKQGNSYKSGHTVSDITSNKVNDNALTNGQRNIIGNTNILSENARTGSVTNAGFDEIVAESFRLSISTYPYFRPGYSLDKEPLLTFEKPYIPKKDITKKTPKTYRSNYNTKDFDSKWWFEIGMGPQITLNTIKVKNDSIEYIHKDLWSNRKKVTSNGTGFQSHASILYKFGKNNRFSLETGINYSLRTEDIKMNESTSNIEHRDNSGKIDFYLRFLIFIQLNGDTTWFDATQGFVSIQKNKYQTFAIPLSFQSEHRLNDNTFLSLGVGGGMSMIYSRSATHMDLVSETNKTEIKKTQFSSTLRASFALYTNFNDIGQIGIYSGFQVYNSPWKVNNGQYAIKMSDLQFGITFRKPLNWKLGN